MSLQAHDAHDLAIEAARTPGKIDFDFDLDGFTSEVLTSYAGLHWSGGAVIDSHKAFDGDAPESGYITGITSGRQVAFDAGGKSMTFSADGTFDFKKVQMTAAWASDLTVDITAYLDGDRKYHTTVHVSDLGPTLITLNWKGIDQVKMRPSHAIVDPDQPHTGNHFVIDDLVVTNLVSAGSVAHLPPALANAFAGDTFAHGHDLLSVSAGQHMLAALTVLA